MKAAVYALYIILAFVDEFSSPNSPEISTPVCFNEREITEAIQEEDLSKPNIFEISKKRFVDSYNDKGSPFETLIKEGISLVNEDDLLTTYPCYILSKKPKISFIKFVSHVSKAACDHVSITDSLREECVLTMQWYIDLYGHDVLNTIRIAQEICTDVLVLEDGSVKLSDKVIHSCEGVSIPDEII